MFDNIMGQQNDQPRPTLIPETDLTVDRVEYGVDWVKGYRGEQMIVSMSGVLDPSKVQFFDAEGKAVSPTEAPLDDITQLQLVVAEIIEGGM